jgi:hypothetical protein
VRNLRHKILLILVAITIVAEIASIFLWTTNRPVAGEPNARFSLAVNYTIAVADAAVFAALNLVALFWIARRNKVGTVFLIAIAVINRAISNFLFIGGVHGIFITWTAILVIFAVLDYRKLAKP